MYIVRGYTAGGITVYSVVHTTCCYMYIVRGYTAGGITVYSVV